MLLTLSIGKSNAEVILDDDGNVILLIKIDTSDNTKYIRIPLKVNVEDIVIFPDTASSSGWSNERYRILDIET